MASVIIVSIGNVVLPVQWQTITWTKYIFSLTGLIGTKFSQIGIQMQQFSYKEMDLKMPSPMVAISYRPQCAKSVDKESLCRSCPSTGISEQSHGY